MLEKIKESKISFIDVFIICSLLAVGLFYNFLSYAACAVLGVYLFIVVKKERKFIWRTNIASIAVSAITLFYALSVFWAVDSGMAFVGFQRQLTVFLFMLLLMQYDIKTESFLRFVPLVTAFMTVVSAALMQIPALAEQFSVSGRLAGFLQYPNTYALLCLVSIILVATKDKLGLIDLIVIAILVFGIFYSGSRTVFVLLVLCAVLITIFHKNKRVRISFLLIILLICIAAAVYAFALNNFETIGRFLRTSIYESTFVGRILYFYDSLSVILTHPFGLGSDGYFYIQNSIQTGLYSTRYIHNDFLQLVLDIGFLPCVLFLVAIVKAFFSKGAGLSKRLIIFVVTAHSMFDINLQFIGIFCLFLLVLDCNKGKTTVVKKRKPTSYISGALIVTALFSIYMTSANVAYYLQATQLSHQLYPWNTDVNIALLTQQTEPDKMSEYADIIIEQNEYIGIAYSAKARSEYSKGNFKKVIDYGKKAIECAPFSYDEYEDYCNMLIVGVGLYEQAGDENSRQICIDELKATVAAWSQIENRLSNLGKMINDKPDKKLPDDIVKYTQVM